MEVNEFVSRSSRLTIIISGGTLLIARKRTLLNSLRPNLVPNAELIYHMLGIGLEELRLLLSHSNLLVADAGFRPGLPPG